MLASVDWQSVHVAGAFILGAVFATIATLRLVRIVAGYLRRERDADGGHGDQG